jgi:hypothetical protein
MLPLGFALLLLLGGSGRCRAMQLLHWGWRGLVACSTGRLELVLRFFLLLGRRLVCCPRFHGSNSVGG